MRTHSFQELPVVPDKTEFSYNDGKIIDAEIIEDVSPPVVPNSPELHGVIEAEIVDDEPRQNIPGQRLHTPRGRGGSLRQAFSELRS